VWYIFVLFYLYGAASSSLVNITDLYGSWVPLTPLNWTFAQACGNSTLMISTTFQLGTNGSYVEKFLVGSGNSTEEEDFLKSVILAIETLGDINIDYDYKKENETIRIPVPSASNPSSNPSVEVPEPSIVNVPTPEPSRQPEEPEVVPVPEPVMNQSPEPVPEPVMNQTPEPGTFEEPTPSSENPEPVPEPVMNQSPEPTNVPTTEEPVPEPTNIPTTEEPVPSSQNPEVEPVPEPMIVVNGRRAKRVEISVLPPINNTVNNNTGLPPLVPALNVTNSTEQEPSPSINNSTLNATTTNTTSQWVHVFFTPKTFNVTILSNETDIYYIKNGPCMPLINYWKDVTLGCPCNGTWNNTGYYNSSSKCFEGGRQITPSLCPNNTCQESFFLNDTTVYANLRLNTTTWSNGTVANKTLEITKVSLFKEIGYEYGEKDIIAVFLLSNGTELPRVVQETSGKNETEKDSGSVSLPLTSVVTLMFAFLLMMYENTQ